MLYVVELVLIALVIAVIFLVGWVRHLLRALSVEKELLKQARSDLGVARRDLQIARRPKDIFVSADFEWPEEFERQPKDLWGLGVMGSFTGIPIHRTSLVDPGKMIVTN